jgi:predicted polyphosphate/ATP-dependent NAD kinase
LKTPVITSLILSEKVSTSIPDIEVMKEAIAARVVEDMEPEVSYILGPGSTVMTIAEKLGVEKTLLGVDIIRNRKLIKSDTSEKDLLKIIDEKSRIIISPLGGQGSLLGHGNQQISPKVIRKVGLDSLIVVATPAKLKGLSSLSVDTGDRELDQKLRGYIRVIIGYHEEKVMRVI